ncbi:hypothetical protein BU14_1293s0003 [Porphyra umbilicalis]|uniref:Uncharacterized protein n=1 Tax=Porphyra umbilicalis TaxID=2786 RepID=A0A1X6NLZ3_PORUM|nr:hypothetical protein BU14_1293s0003 [Porphyra umbilicalis]|eukprot:OSX69661.1 hypothetical protein BU14_1293s0003 [Porphyra umbilicalis]
MCSATDADEYDTGPRPGVWPLRRRAGRGARGRGRLPGGAVHARRGCLVRLWAPHRGALLIPPARAPYFVVDGGAPDPFPAGACACPVAGGGPAGPRGDRRRRPPRSRPTPPPPVDAGPPPCKVLSGCRHPAAGGAPGGGAPPRRCPPPPAAAGASGRLAAAAAVAAGVWGASPQARTGAPAAV